VNEKQAHETIAQWFKTQWQTLYPAMPIVFANEIGSSVAEWVRIAFVPATSQQTAVGALKRWTRAGTIGVQIFTLAANGTGRASELADAVRTVLEGKFLLATGDDEPVVTYGGASGTPLSDGAWFMQTVTVPYRFDELHA
jgi:hypothetical protein